MHKSVEKNPLGPRNRSSSNLSDRRSSFKKLLIPVADIFTSPRSPLSNITMCSPTQYDLGNNEQLTEKELTHLTKNEILLIKDSVAHVCDYIAFTKSQ